MECTMNRREFCSSVARSGAAVIAGRVFLLAGTGAAALVLEGCDVMTEIQDWVPVGESALNSILVLLGANGIVLTPVIMLAESALNAALTDLVAAVTAYKATNPPPQGAVAKVEAMLSAVVSSFGNFFSQLNLPGGSLYSLILNLIKLAISTVQGFINEIMPTPTPAVKFSFQQQGLPKQFEMVPAKKRRRANFKSAWNDIIVYASLGLVVPKQARLHVTFRESLSAY